MGNNYWIWGLNQTGQIWVYFYDFLTIWTYSSNIASFILSFIIYNLEIIKINSTVLKSSVVL